MKLYSVWWDRSPLGLLRASQSDLVDVGTKCLHADDQMKKILRQLQNSGVKLLNHFGAHTVPVEMLGWAGFRGDYARSIIYQNADQLIRIDRKPWVVVSDPDLFGNESVFGRNTEWWASNYAEHAAQELYFSDPQYDGILIDTCPDDLVAEMRRQPTVFEGEEYIIEEHIEEWEMGSEEFCQIVREVMGDKYLLIPNGDAVYPEFFDGRYFESFGGQWRSPREDLEMLQRLISLNWHSERDRQIVIGYKASEDQYSAEYARFTAALALMTGSYHGVHIGWQFSPPGGWVWMDEYAVDPKGRATKNVEYKNWHGSPVGEIHMEGGVVWQEYEHALAIASLWETILGPDLLPKGNWHSIAGLDEANTGNPVEWPLYMPAKSGLVFFRKDYPTVKSPVNEK